MECQRGGGEPKGASADEPKSAAKAVAPLWLRLRLRLLRRLHIINLLRQPHSLGLHQLLCVQNVLPFPGTVPVPGGCRPACHPAYHPACPCTAFCRRMLATFLSYAVPGQVAKLPSCRVAGLQGCRVAMLWSSTLVDFLCCICLARGELRRRRGLLAPPGPRCTLLLMRI